MMEIRPAAAEDAAAIFTITEQTGMFSADELGFMREMIESDLHDASGERRWFVAASEEDIGGAGCLSPEPLQDDVQNLLFLGVRRDRRRGGLATSLVRDAVETARRTGARLLLVETSSGDLFVAARALYRGLGFEVDGRIRDYYGAGEDKVIFRLTL